MTLAEPASHAVSGVALTLRGVRRDYAGVRALQQVDLRLEPGAVLALLGPSGCGKSTLLKLLAGLEAPSDGEIWFGERLVATAHEQQPPQRRQLGMVFQDYALWPHLSVFANVAFPLQMQKVPRGELVQRVQQALQSVGLEHLAQRAPAALSGGQQQRVALARALVARPSLLLFDEPLSNLDRDLRESLSEDIARLLRELGTTAIYVTHDHEEACAVADQVAVMRQGQVEQIASPRDLWNAPASAWVARFLKLGAVLPARRNGQGVWLGEGLPCLAVPGNSAGSGDMDTGELLVPDSAIVLCAPDGSAWQARVHGQQYRSGSYRTTLHLPNGAVLHTDTRQRLAARQAVGLHIDAAQLRWFAASDHTAMSGG